MALILASASPRRQMILEQLGIAFRVQVSGASEDLEGVDAWEAPRLFAERKALQISLQEPGHRVLGYDTLVFLDHIALGKPKDAEDARQTLESLRDRWHDVRTGFALALNGKILVSGQETTRVLFRPFTKVELDDYIAGGEPFDKAGSYGIQGQGARLVKAIDGCYYNVVGLPVTVTLDALREFPEI